MRKSNYVYGIVILLLLISLIPYPIVYAPPPQSQTISIIDTRDDLFITEAGVGIDSQLCHILDPNMDIRSFLLFEDININYWEPLTNATLRLRTTANLNFDADSSVTVYGMKYSDLQLEGVLNPGWVISVPLTIALVDVNTSQFYGQQWHEINVTEIVRELINSVRWDGDGADGTETGDSIGFVILGAEGSDTRWFIDYLYGVPNLAPQLVIHWDHEPPPPSSDAPPPYNDTDDWTWEYLNTTRGIDIFTVTDYGDIELQYTSSSSLDYHNSTTGVGGVVQWSAGGFDLQSAGAMEFIAVLYPWVFLVGDNASHRVYYSDDEFSDNILVADPGNQYADLAPYQGDHGSIILDQEDTQTLHMVWTTPTPWNPGTYNVVYTNFTILENGNLIWADSYENITAQGANQYDPDIYCEMDGTLHVTWYGQQGTVEDQIWYRRRFANGTWGSQVRVSEGDAFGSIEPDVIANEETGEALIAWTYSDVAPDIRWDTVYPNNTDGTDQQITNAIWVSMVNERENNVAHLAYGTLGGNPSVDYRYKTIDNVTAWSAAEDVSPNGEKERYPTISLDEQNETLAVIWWDEWSGRTSFNYWQITDGPDSTKSAFIATLQLRYPSSPDYHGRHIDQVVYFTAYPNGTIQGGPFDTLDDALIGIEDALGHDPEDPTPPGTDWESGPGGSTGPFTRFRMRMYILIIGFGCFFGPVLFFSWKKPTGYYLLVGALIMILGIGLMISIGDI